MLPFGIRGDRGVVELLQNCNKDSVTFCELHLATCGRNKDRGMDEWK